MPHYYDEEQVGPIDWFTVRCRTKDHEMELWSANGVFSKNTLDNGTRLLIETMQLDDEWRVHDLGCGIGVVGIAVKLGHPSCTVLCSDVSRRAVKVAKRNVKALDLDIAVKQSDGYENIEGTFDTVLLNPPYAAGRETVFRLVGEAKQHLVPGGLLQVVARHQKGGKAIMERMEELFDNVDDSRKGSGYRVYVSRNV